ncbi:MAG: AAA family ATPase, partial [Victivallaceae bacterium]
YLLYFAERKLRSAPANSSYFLKTNAEEEKRQGLEALRNGKKDWYSIRTPAGYQTEILPEDRIFKLRNTPFPFFSTYLVDNGLEDDLLALKELCAGEPEVALLSPEYEFNLENTIECEYDNFILKDGLFQLYNDDILDDLGDRETLRPVFVTDHPSAAKKMQTEMINDYIEFLKSELTWATGQNYESSPTVSNWKQDFESSKRPCGDAVWAAPVGGYTIPWRTDWRKLGDRDIFIFRFRETDTEKIIRELLDVTAAIIDNVGKQVTKRLHFVIMSQKNYHELPQNNILYLSLDELFERYVDRAIEIPSALKGEYENFLRRTRHKPRSHYIIAPFLRQKSWMLITGEEGVGKTYFAMALGAAIASGGKLFWDWKVRNRGGKVLYIADDEMTDDLIHERVRVLRKIYPKVKNRFFIHPVHDLNLIAGEGKFQVDQLLNQYAREGDESAVQIIFLDHLLKLSGAEGDQKYNWVQIRNWIEELCNRGISVCLLHHEYGGRKMLGTRLIANDAPARIHLQPPSTLEDISDDCIRFDVAIQKNRGGHDQKIPKLLILRLGDSPGWIENKKLVGEIRNSPAEWKKLSSEERMTRVRELRASYTNRDIATRLGCSLSSIEKIVQSLPENEKRPKKLMR